MSFISIALHVFMCSYFAFGVSSRETTVVNNTLEFRLLIIRTFARKIDIKALVHWTFFFGLSKHFPLCHVCDLLAPASSFVMFMLHVKTLLLLDRPHKWFWHPLTGPFVRQPRDMEECAHSDVPLHKWLSCKSEELERSSFWHSSIPTSRCAAVHLPLCPFLGRMTQTS